MRLILATANPDKAAEIRAILAGVIDVELVERPSDLAEVEETADTLEGNAWLKARALASATGEGALADDTGLEVHALGGRPGVFSARYAGEKASYADNVAKLLAELAGQEGPALRRARFRTVAVAHLSDGRELASEGEVAGTIAPEARGQNGFGYDPVFVPDDGDGRTFAEMTSAEKHALSHRARAFRGLAAALTSL
ncbi:MAG: RdgB/HAM1 family non-canonical purine NTP pyrophosphatase [Acidimicrobiales bacterium]